MQVIFFPSKLDHSVLVDEDKNHSRINWHRGSLSRFLSLVFLILSHYRKWFTHFFVIMCIIEIRYFKTKSNWHDCSLHCFFFKGLFSCLIIRQSSGYCCWLASNFFVLDPSMCLGQWRMTSRSFAILARLKCKLILSLLSRPHTQYTEMLH